MPDTNYKLKKRSNKTEGAKFKIGDKVLKPDRNGTLRTKKGVICGRKDLKYTNGRTHPGYYVMFEGKSEPTPVAQAMLIPDNGQA